MCAYATDTDWLLGMGELVVLLSEVTTYSWICPPQSDQSFLILDIVDDRQHHRRQVARKRMIHVFCAYNL